MADNRKYIAIKPTTLSTGVNVGDTTCIPSQIKDRLGNSITAMTSFGTKGFGVISPDTDKEEQFVFTGLSGGTVSGISAVTMQDPYTETSGWLKEHAAGEPIILYTNSPAFYNDFANVQNDNTFVGTQTFPETAMPRISAAHTYGVGEEEFIATKRYVDGVVTGGAADANTTTKGLVEEATQAEIAAGTAAGGTSARLFTNPSTLAAHIQSGAWLSGSTAGTADALTATLTPTLTALTHNMTFALHITTANNAGCTLNVDGLGAKAVYKYAGGTAVAAEANDMQVNYHHIFLYDSDTDVFLLVNPVNGTLTSAVQALVQNNITDLTDGGSTTAHTHNSLLHTHSHFIAVEEASVAAAGLAVCSSGFSDDTTKLIGAGHYTGGAVDRDGAYIYSATSDLGNVTYLQSAVLLASDASSSTGTILGIGTNVWTNNSSATAGNRIRKDGGAVTISGTTPDLISGTAGKIGHDPANSYLLVLDATTRIRRYSGIAGTTITYVDAITLDTAVSNNGFLYDNTNQRYICLDTTNNLIRRFNSSGTTVDTVAYTVNDTNVVGLCFIGDRVYLVIAVRSAVDGTYTRYAGITLQFVPTNMTR